MTRFLLFSLLLWCPLLATLSQPRYDKMSPLLRQLARQAKRVKASSGRDDSRRVCAFVRLGEGDDSAVTARGGQILLRKGTVCVADLPVAQLGALSADRRIARMEAERGRRPVLDSMAVHLNALPAYAGINLPQAFTGRGVVVGVMDIGFDLTHPTFRSATGDSLRIRRFWDQLSPDTLASPLYLGRDFTTESDLLAVGCSHDGRMQWHGTHTSAIAAGNGCGTPYRGTAPESELCLVANAVSDDLPLIDSTNIYKYTYATDALGFRYIYNYAEAVGKPCVISFSEGSLQDFHGNDLLFYEMLDSLTGPGRLLVVAAGNEGTHKTWFRKPKGTPSMGTFIRKSESTAALTLKSPDPFTLRIVAYGTPNDTILMLSDSVFAQPDSTLTASLCTGGASLDFELSGYLSCYNPAERCFDLGLSTNRQIGRDPRLSVEVVGTEADVEAYCVSGGWVTYDENPHLDAGEPSHNLLSPASWEGAIAVGATGYRNEMTNAEGETLTFTPTPWGRRSTYSSTGPTFSGAMKPDVMAPGSNIISAFNRFYEEANPDNPYEHEVIARTERYGRPYGWITNAGTSMAAPAAAGVIALWLEAKPELTTEQVLDAIAHTATHPDPSLSYPNNLYGHGQIDAYAGLLYVLGLTDVKALSKNHTAARISAREGTLFVALPHPASAPLRLRLFTTAGTCVAQFSLSPGQNEASFALPHLSTGIYAVQIDGEKAVKGSTLIRL